MGPMCGCSLSTDSLDPCHRVEPILNPTTILNPQTLHTTQELPPCPSKEARCREPGARANRTGSSSTSAQGGGSGGGSGLERRAGRRAPRNSTGRQLMQDN